MKIELRNWYLIYNRLNGNVYGHPNPRHNDGKEITTSSVIGKRNGLVVTKSGSEYDLVDVSPDYEKTYPNAKERMMNSLPEV